MVRFFNIRTTLGSKFAASSADRAIRSYERIVAEILEEAGYPVVLTVSASAEALAA